MFVARWRHREIRRLRQPQQAVPSWIWRQLIGPRRITHTPKAAGSNVAPATTRRHRHCLGLRHSGGDPIWFVTGTWFPWPLFTVFRWGIGLGFHAWDAYGRRPFSDEEVRREEALLDRR